MVGLFTTRHRLLVKRCHSRLTSWFVEALEGDSNSGRKRVDVKLTHNAANDAS